MQKETKSSIVLVVTNIIMLIVFIALLIFRTKFTYSLYWFIIPLLIVVLMYFINLWTKTGNNPDNRDAKMMERSVSDVTAVSTVIYAFVYLIIMFMDSFKIEVSSNLYIAISFYLITLIYEWIIYTSISKANKENIRLAKKYNLLDSEINDSNDTKK